MNAPGRYVMRRSLLALGAATALAVLLAGCSSLGEPPQVAESRALFDAGRPEESLRMLQNAMRESPGNLALRNAYYRQLEMFTAQMLATADAARAAQRYDDARAAYQRLLAIDPGNVRANDGLAAVAASQRRNALIAEAEKLVARGQTAEAEVKLRLVLAEEPAHPRARALVLRLREQQAGEIAAPKLRSSLKGPITLEFRDTPLRSVFDVIARTSGVNFVFDRDVRTENRITIFVRNTPIEDVIALILQTNQLDRKVLNDNSLLIYPRTAAKAKEYQELVVRSFFLANADVKQAQSIIRTVARTPSIYLDEKLNVITVRDTPEAVQLVERLIQTIDVAEPEVMLEVEVLEVTRAKLQEIGIDFPTEVQLQSKLPIPSSTPAGRIDLSQSSLIWTIANPALRLNLLSQDTDVSVLANPRIRAKNREKARILIGEKLPVFTSTAVPNAGLASSVSYIDVGLKLDVEPNVFLENEVGIRVSLEVSNTLEKVSGPDGTIAYRLGTRSAQTNLRVRDGETQVLGGLINRNERQTLSKLPGLGDLPGIGRAFGSNGLQSDKTELVLLITPRIVRNLQPGMLESATIVSGTDAAVGARPLTMRPTPLRSLAMSSAPTRAVSSPTPAAAGADAQVAQPAAAPDAVPSDTPLAAVLTVPESVVPGAPFTASVLVDTAVMRSGEVIITFDPLLLRVDGGQEGRATVRLAPTADGKALTGSVNVQTLTRVAGNATLEFVEGSAAGADGTPRPLNGNSASLRIGQ